MRTREARAAERLRADALREFAQAVLGRELRPGESSVRIVLQVAAALKRGLDRRSPAGMVESIHEAALRHLVEVLDGRPLGPDETSVGRALDLVARYRETGASVPIARARREVGGDG